MGISDRFNNWVEDRRQVWGAALSDFILGSISKGIYKALEDMEPGAIEGFQDALASMRDDPNMPPEFKVFFEKMTKPGNPFIIAAGVLIVLLMLIPMVMGAFQPLGNLWNYAQERIFKSGRLDILTAIKARWRGFIDDNELYNTLADFGFNDEDKETLKKVSRFYPSAQDLITWIAREVFEPAAIERFGLADEFDLVDLSLFEGAGVDEEQAKNYWIAHWEHASFIQVVEMLHRGLLTRGRGVPKEPTGKAEWEARDKEGTEFLDEWFRIVEIPPIYRPLMTEMSWNVPTRVDVRRFRDMEVISKEELYSIYHRQGYHGADLDKYVLWTEVYNRLPSLLSRWQNGWITEEDIQDELAELGMPADRIETMLQEKIKKTTQKDVSDALDLTKAEVYKGVKDDKLTQNQGVEIIQRIGFNRATAEYLVDLNTSVLTGSPENYAEFQDLVTKYLRAVGKEAVPMPDTLKEAASNVVQLTEELQLIRAELAKFNAEVIDVEPVPKNVLQQRTELEAKVADAEIQLTYAKTRYETELAKWRHSR